MFNCLRRFMSTRISSWRSTAVSGAPAAETIVKQLPRRTGSSCSSGSILQVNNSGDLCFEQKVEDTRELNVKSELQNREPIEPESHVGLSQPDVNLTQNFCTQLDKLTMKKSEFLRLLVEPGGCFGLLWKFKIDSRLNSKIDLKIREKFVVDKFTMSALKDSTIDFEDTLMSQKFVVKSIPKSTTGCSCGASFDPQ